MTGQVGTEAQRAYDRFAASYDDFNCGYMYEQWTGRLLALAEEAGGLAGDRLLDLACGTGLSFITMLERGWSVTGCDISPAMIERARVRAKGRAELLVVDMRSLPRLGEFDLIWSINDSVNYLLEEADLRAALAGMRRNLAQGGTVLFDVNTLTTYRTFFATDHVVEHGGRRMIWSGLASADAITPDSIFEARFSGVGDGVQSHMHRQRHYGEGKMLAALAEAGLSCVRVAGELDGALSTDLDEDRHTKAVYVCRAADA